MPLISMRQPRDHAAEHGYGVAAFNAKRTLFDPTLKPAACDKMPISLFEVAVSSNESVGGSSE